MYKPSPEYNLDLKLIMSLILSPKCTDLNPATERKPATYINFDLSGLAKYAANNLFSLHTVRSRVSRLCSYVGMAWTCHMLQSNGSLENNSAKNTVIGFQRYTSVLQQHAFSQAN